MKIGNILVKILLPMQKTSDSFMIALDNFFSQNFIRFLVQSPGVAAAYTLF